VAGETLDRFFATWRVDDRVVDISDLTPFEQAALRAAAKIPPGQVRSYAWVAAQIGRPKAARAVGRVMARNPLRSSSPAIASWTPRGAAQLLLRARYEAALAGDGRYRRAR